MLAIPTSASGCEQARSTKSTRKLRQHSRGVQVSCRSKGKDQGKDDCTKRPGLAQFVRRTLGLPPQEWYLNLSDAVASVQSQQQTFQSQLHTFRSQLNGFGSQLKTDIPQIKADLAAVVEN